jgi:hypothetical protein
MMNASPTAIFLLLAVGWANRVLSLDTTWVRKDDPHEPDF